MLVRKIYDAKGIQLLMTLMTKFHKGPVIMMERDLTVNLQQSFKCGNASALSRSESKAFTLSPVTWQFH